MKKLMSLLLAGVAIVALSGCTDKIDGDIVHNGVTYGTVASPYTDRVWLDRNLGAARVCEQFDDTACYGDYYQWGRNFDGHQDSTSGTTSTQATDVNNAGNEFITSSDTYNYDWAQAADANGSLRSANWSKTDGSSVCPVGFRAPTYYEFQDELESADINNSADAFASFLKLPSAGLRNSDDFQGFQGSVGFLWLGSVGGCPIGSHYLHFATHPARIDCHIRASGLVVRCIKD